MRQRNTPRRRGRRCAGLLALIAATVTALFIVPSAFAVTGAGFTTVNESAGAGDGTGHCKNGNPLVNCNIYDGKQYVWLNGGPDVAYVGDGTYFFAVLVPGGQLDPNDGATKNLSDGLNGAYTTRTFTVTGGTVAYAKPPGTHDFDSNKIRLLPYDNTTNPGGVYIMAICSLGDGDDYPVAPSSCKYDAFKIREGTTTSAENLAIEKGADASFTRTFGWTVVKTVDNSESVDYSQTGSTRNLAYKVVYTKLAGDDSDWSVFGTITVTNPNQFDVTGVGVTDQLNDDPATVCTVESGSYPDGNGNDVVVPSTGGTIPALTAVDYDYTCSPDDTDATLNTATAAWAASGPNNALAAGSKDGSHSVTWPDPTLVHDCVDVSDTNLGNVTDGSMPTGSICDSTTFDYTVTVSVPTGCVTINNTAAFADGTYTGSDSTTARVCRTPGATGALTIGYWQNKNGQTIIKNYGGSYCQAVKNFLLTFNPFNETALSSKTTCGNSASLQKGASSTGVVGYVYDVIKAAKCTSTTSTCNSMLKAQMLATALNVYFSASSLSLGSTTYPGGALSLTLGGNRIGAPASIASAGGIGTVTIDLTQVCTMIDGAGGTATCSGSYKDASGVFGGHSSLRIIEMLYYMNTDDSAHGNSTAGQPVSNLGGTNWYKQIKSKQVCAKDAFDAINNRVAFIL
jgi:hypothetical protein